MEEPQKQWIPGVLSPAQMAELCNRGWIIGNGSPEDAIDNSAIDLSLSGEAYRMVQGSVKPSGSSSSYGWFIKHEKLAEVIKPAQDGTFTLNSRGTYVFKLNERLSTKALAKAEIHGQATAKSSIGRVDVLARLIVDGMDTYECFNPKGLLTNSTGDMYLEITPITFHVKVKPGICLSQLRLFYDEPTDVEMKGKELFKTALQGPGAEDGSLTVDLENVQIGGLSVAAFCAIGNKPDDPIPLWEEPNEDDRPKPWKYWKFEATDSTLRLKIKETNFYLLRSRERISVPGGVAIYCRASDETIGEMRIHYAGFVHPLFGERRTDGTRGTPLMFEVRGHQVDVSLTNREKLANLKFYRMSKDVPQDLPNDMLSVKPTPYENQRLQLSKVFGQWPDKLRRNSDGTVEPA